MLELVDLKCNLVINMHKWYKNSNIRSSNWKYTVWVTYHKSLSQKCVHLDFFVTPQPSDSVLTQILLIPFCQCRPSASALLQIYLIVTIPPGFAQIDIGPRYLTSISMLIFLPSAFSRYISSNTCNCCFSLRLWPRV